MSDFVNKIKTILQLDEKDWKKSLESVNQAQKDHATTFKKLQRENQEVLNKTSIELVKQKDTVVKTSEEITSKIKEKVKARNEERQALEKLNKAIIKNNEDEIATARKIYAEKQKQVKEHISLLNKEITQLRERKAVETSDVKKTTSSYKDQELNIKKIEGIYRTQYTPYATHAHNTRSEERRVGKEC